MTAELLEPTLVPGTILVQGKVTSAETPYLNVTIAVPPTSTCRATQLGLAYVAGQGFTGSDSGFVAVRDTSPEWCSFAGPVTLWGSASTGRVVTEKLTKQVPNPIVLSAGVTAPMSLTQPTGVVQASIGFAAVENVCIPTGGEPTTPTKRVTPAAMNVGLTTGGTLTTPNYAQGSSEVGFVRFVACYGQFSPGMFSTTPVTLPRT